MDNLNRTISFILGLVVVIVFLAFITGRLNLKGRLPIIGDKPTPTPTNLTPTPTTRLTPMVTQRLTITPTNPAYHPYSSIPATGSPTLLLPILLSGLAGGIFLRKRS